MDKTIIPGFFHRLLHSISRWYVLTATLLAVLAVGFICLRHCPGVPTYHILVIQSGETDYQPYDRYQKQLEKALSRKHIKARIDYFYLCCERYNEPDEIARLDSVVNSYADHLQPDLIIVNGDQATYSLLSTRNPRLRRLPVIFGAVRFPNRKVLAEYAPYRNVTGLYDSIDIPANIKFIRDMSGRGSVITQIDDSYLDRQTVAMVDRQLATHPEIYNNLHWTRPLVKVREAADKEMVLTSISLRHSERMASNETVRNRMKKTLLNMSIDTSEVDKFGLSASLADRKMIGTQNYLFIMNRFNTAFTYLALKNETGTLQMLDITPSMVFSGIDENFDMNRKSKVVGGYFTTWETTADEEADMAYKVLVDSIRPSDIPIKVPHKDYVLDWNLHKEMAYAKVFNDVPPYVKVINKPFEDSHPLIFWALIHGSVTLAVLLIVYFFILFRHEQRKKRMAYESLMEERENLKLAFLGSKSFVWELQDQRLFMTDEFYKSMNVPLDKWHREELKDILWFIKPQYRGTFRQFLLKQEVGEQNVFQCEFDFDNGNTGWWEIRTTTMLTGNRRKKTLGMCIEISDIKHHEEELEKARRKAVEGERMAEEARKLAEEVELKQSFLANMSHEIRTPLNAIVGFSNLLAYQTDELSEDDKKMFVDNINHNSDLLLRLINDVLEISRIESGYMKFDFRRVAVERMIDDVYQANRFQIPKHLKFLVEKGPGSLHIFVDEGRLQQVLTNFVTNAGKFTPSGSITLGWTYDEAAREVELYVEDTGIGLSEVEQRLVFGRFYKSDEFKQGTGLGLSISKVIVERLHGRIRLKSKLGEGSRFSVVLKVMDEQKQNVTPQKQ